MRVRIVGHDPGRGVLIEGRTLFPGDEVEVSDRWAAWLMAQGRAVRVEAVAVAVPVVEHRDPVVRRKR